MVFLLSNAQHDLLAFHLSGALSGDPESLMSLIAEVIATSPAALVSQMLPIQMFLPILTLLQLFYQTTPDATDKVLASDSTLINADNSSNDSSTGQPKTANAIGADTVAPFVWNGDQPLSGNDECSHRVSRKRTTAVRPVVDVEDQCSTRQKMTQAPTRRSEEGHIEEGNIEQSSSRAEQRRPRRQRRGSSCHRNGVAVGNWVQAPGPAPLLRARLQAPAVQACFNALLGDEVQQNLFGDTDGHSPSAIGREITEPLLKTHQDLSALAEAVTRGIESEGQAMFGAALSLIQFALGISR
jgi:hypothetical protein